MLRNTIYPAYLALPLYFLKVFGLDSNMVVLLQPYISQAVLVLVGDYFFFKAGKKYVGKNATRLGFIILFFSKQHTDYLIRCFTNAVEEILSVIAFYYFLDQKNRFNMRTVILTTTITLSFMMRNTSPIGWIPLLAIKVLYEGALVPFLIAGIFVAVPVITATVLIDTLYFTGTISPDKIVFTAWNFFIRNLREGLSEYFGSSYKQFYIGDSIPEGFWILYGALTLGSFYHIYKRWRENKSPYLSYAIFFYLIVFSYIPHKEPRFMLPIYSFGVLVGGEITELAFKRSNLDLRRIWSLLWVGYMVR